MTLTKKDVKDNALIAITFLIVMFGVTLIHIKLAEEIIRTIKRYCLG